MFLVQKYKINTDLDDMVKKSVDFLNTNLVILD